MGYAFRRARRTPAKAPGVAQEAAARRALVKMHRLEAQGRCRVLYGDESGFCLQPCLPYLWQARGPGQTLGLPAQSHGKRLNALGFLHSSLNSHLHACTTTERVTAEFFVQSVEEVLPHLPADRPTVLVLDNSRVHRAQVVQAKRAEWKRRGLRLFFLPPYCPHLNRIEVLWRQVKYRWLAPQAYADFPTLCHHVTSILHQIGGKYRLSFA